MESLKQFASVFEPKLLNEIEEKATEVTVNAGEVILNYGKIVRSIPIIAAGTVKVMRMDENEREILLYYVSSKESCAMTFTCCMEQFPSEIKAVAETPVEMLTVPVKFMDDWLVKYSSWKRFVMGTIRDRFNEMLSIIDQVAFQKLDERLIHYLNPNYSPTLVIQTTID